MGYKYKSENFLTQNQFRVNLPAGNISAIDLSFEFTNQAGQSLSQAELGFCRLYSPEGTKIWDFSLQRMYGFVDRKYPGHQRSNTPAGAAGEHYIRIPLRLPNDFNIVRLGAGYVLEFQHDDLAAQISAGFVTIIIQTALGVQRYMPMYNNFEIKSDSAEVTPERFPRRNLAFVTITPTANITNVKFTKDGNELENLTDEQIDRETSIQSDYKSFVTGADDTTPWVLDLVKDGNLTEVLGQNYGLSVVTSDTNATGMDVQLLMTEAALDLTAQVMAGVKDKNAVSPAEKIVAS